MRVRSTMAGEEYSQRNEKIVNDVPEGPPDPPPPPDEPANPSNVYPSVELEREKESVASSDDARTSNEADASGATRRGR